jgi:hypothetical protein
VHYQISTFAEADGVVVFKTRFAFARIIAAAGAETAQFIPTLMTQLLSRFETSELVEFLAFLGLIVHKLQVRLAISCFKTSGINISAT